MNMGAVQVSATSSSVPRLSFYEELRERQPVLAAFSFLMLATMAPTLLAMAIDVRLFNGINVWLKPFKFELSTIVHMVTLAWFWPYLDERLSRSVTVRGVAWAIGLIFVAEVGYIAFRASLAEGSHFNSATPVAAIAYPLMGAAILVVMGLTAWIGVLILRSSAGQLQPPLRLAIGLGLIAGSVLGGVTGAYMSSQTGHWVGDVTSDAGGIPLFGWSRAVGDLRVAHFIGLHAIQGIPVVGYLVRHMAAGRIVVWLTLALWTVATVAVFLQAVQGRPLLPI
jgi:hypothetical protein